MSETARDTRKEVLPGPPLAILAEAFFLANLLIAPAIGFIALLVLWLRHRNNPSPLVRNHLQQTIVASLWGGAVLFGVSVAIFMMGGLDNPWSWVVGVLYFVCFHAALVIGGVIGLNRAILGRMWQYPVIGPDITE